MRPRTRASALRLGKTDEVDCVARLLLDLDELEGAGVGMQAIGAAAPGRVAGGCGTARGSCRPRRCDAWPGWCRARPGRARPRSRPPLRPLPGRLRDSAPRSVAWMCPASASTAPSRSDAVAAVTTTRVEKPRESTPTKPARKAARALPVSAATSASTNRNEPVTAHSPVSAARANTKASDGSRRMVRGSMSMVRASARRLAGRARRARREPAPAASAASPPPRRR